VQAAELTGRIEALQGRLDRLFELLGANGRAS
jgi:hypothetical protein